VLTYSAVRKLSHQPAVVQAYARAGVPEEQLNKLALLLLAASAGLLAGVAWAPLGVAAAAGLVCYFAVAIGFHVRFKDAAHLPTPVTCALMATAVLILRLATM
jgi:hypothetical protein